MAECINILFNYLSKHCRQSGWHQSWYDECMITIPHECYCKQKTKQRIIPLIHHNEFMRVNLWLLLFITFFARVSNIPVINIHFATIFWHRLSGNFTTSEGSVNQASAEIFSITSTGYISIADKWQITWLYKYDALFDINVYQSDFATHTLFETLLLAANH